MSEVKKLSNVEMYFTLVVFYYNGILLSMIGVVTSYTHLDQSLPFFPLFLVSPGTSDFM